MNLKYVQRKIRLLKARIETLGKVQDDPTCILSASQVEEMILTAEAELLKLGRELSACLAARAAEKAAIPPRRMCVYCRATALKGDSRCAKCKKQGRARVKGVPVKRKYDAARHALDCKRNWLKKKAAKLRAEGREVDAMLVEHERENLAALKPNLPVRQLPKYMTEMPTSKAGKRKLSQLKRRLAEEIEAWREVGDYAKARELEIQLQGLPEARRLSPMEVSAMSRYHAKRSYLKKRAKDLRTLGRNDEAVRVEQEREALQPPVQ